MSIKQISVFVENKKGRLYGITNELAQVGVDIRALSLADTTDFGILRLIVDNSELAVDTLKNAGYTVTLTKVLAVNIQDSPGGFAKVVKVLGDKDIDIEYLYAFVSRKTDAAYVVIRVEDSDLTAEILGEAGIEVVSDEQLFDSM